MDIETLKWLLDRFGYLFLFAGAFIDGFHIMIIAGFFIALGAISPIPAFIALLLGNVLSDATWFFIAYYGGEKGLSWLEKYYTKLPAYINKTRRLLDKYTGRILITIKLTLGLALATVLAAGISRMNPKKFFLYNTIGAIGMVVEMLIVGYIFGASYGIASQHFDTLGNIIVALAILTAISISIWNRQKNKNIAN